MHKVYIIKKTTGVFQFTLVNPYVSDPEHVIHLPHTNYVSAYTYNINKTSASNNHIILQSARH